MKKILIVIIIIIVIVLAMFVFKICPPKGPWPTPPWCKTFSINQYDVKVDAEQLSQVKAVNMYDTWGRNYNMNMVETTWDNLESSFNRVQDLGASVVYVHDFDRAIYEKGQDYTSTKYVLADDIFGNDMRDEAISVKHLKKIVTTAHERGLKLGIKRNLTFLDMGSLIVSGIKGTIEQDVAKSFAEFNREHSDEWVKDYFAKWQSRLIEKAKIYQDAGVDIMSVSPTFQDPQFAGHEILANELWKKLISEVKNNFKGQILIDFNVYGLVDGNNGAEQWHKYDYYKDADIVEARVYKILEKYQSGNKNLKQDTIKMVNGLNQAAEDLGIKIHIFFAPSSYVDGLYLGPVEYLDVNSDKIKKLSKDYEVQAMAIDEFFRTTKDKQNIIGLNIGNFAWDDALDPDVRARVSVSAGFRNKPAETVVKEWYKE